MDKLEEKAVRGDGQLHWKRDSTPPSEDTYWYRAPSAEVKMTSYVLLAYLSGPVPDIGKAAQIVNWLSKQQNPYGGFSSTQVNKESKQPHSTINIQYMQHFYVYFNEDW
ncbi:alpha-2-macroglobulin-like [Bufo bufo]|uniref:alpha-2-macroglobulin-like n=1 Tax=Bufo bufo TaxID=8384 RepID=UPI001ABE06FC|nr:alpha-2-macroglobulin-like [Bufo bufo]